MGAGNKKVLLFKTESADDALCQWLRFHQWEVYQAQSVAYAQALIDEHGALVGLAWLENVGGPALDKVEELIRHDTQIKWILVLPRQFAQDSENFPREHQLINEYCHDFHTLPVDPERLLFCLGHAHGLTEIGRHGRHLKSFYGSLAGETLVGRSAAMLKLRNQVAKLSKQDSVVMIVGESGTGKGLIAQLLHHNSARARQPFVSIDCESLAQRSGSLDLYGDEDAVKPAAQTKIGLIESAQGGTLFLQGIGKLTAEQQFDFFRLIKEKSLRRRGGNEKIPLNIRIIVSSETDLADEVRNGEFRSDFFFFLRMIRLEVPPLRNRDADVVLLADYFFKKIAKSHKSKIQGFSENCLQVMQQYAWPGNVRELRNCIEQAIVMSENRWLSPDDLALERRSRKRYLSTLEEYRAEADQDAILSAMRYANYNITKAAKILNVSRVTLYSLIDKYNLRFVSSQGKSAQDLE